MHKKKLVIFKYFFGVAETIEKHYWMYSHFRIGWRGCQRLQMATAEDVFFEVQADVLENQLRETFHDADGGEDPAAPHGADPGAPHGANPASAEGAAAAAPVP